MMKIKTDEYNYLLPLKTGINILIENDCSEEIITCLISYFGNKKKTSCSILDDDNNIILPKEFEFIYIPSKENIINNYHFKEKSVINNYLSELINKHPELFNSIDRVRQDIEYLLTDSGIYNLKRIMNKNLDININIDIEDFDISSILEMLYITNEGIDKSEMVASIYNILMTDTAIVNRIIYIDFPIKDKLMRWINNLDNKDIIIINSTSIIEEFRLSNCSAIIISEGELFNEIDLSCDDLGRFIYMTKPYIINNISYQKEENILFLTNFTDKNTTYLVNFQ